MDKFQNTYRIPSARWQNWDYRWAGAYFITIRPHRIATVSEYWQKFGVVDYWFVQIGGYQTCPPVGFCNGMAGTFSRSCNS